MRNLFVFLALVVLVGCSDLSTFKGRWSGSVVNHPALLVGLSPTASVALEVDSVDRTSLAGRLQVGEETVALRPLSAVKSDGLGAAELPDSPLATFWVAVSLADGDAIGVVSLFSDDKVDLRLLRSDTLFGVFHLTRK
jgi:hypothetical protein